METEVGTKILQKPRMQTDVSFQMAANRRQGYPTPHKCQSIVFGVCYTHTAATDRTVEIFCASLSIDDPNDVLGVTLH
jgi:hypothetical protein